MTKSNSEQTWYEEQKAWEEEQEHLASESAKAEADAQGQEPKPDSLEQPSPLKVVPSVAAGDTYDETKTNLQIFEDGVAEGIRKVVVWQSDNCVCQSDEDSFGNRFMVISVPIASWESQLKKWGVGDG